ncbi:ROK family protein [Enterococcus timonensis]|uniref:ROK family protein n=1 Tax=Enterococcus timonensis TaxID=1852364 RepID=UPI0008DB2C63|nr:ROK family protein [Enterococcus timonensis]
MIFCLDVGGTFIKLGIFDKEGNFVVKEKFPTPKNSQVAFFQVIKEKFQEYQKKYFFQGIGVSFPGIFDPATGETIYAGALPIFNQTNLLNLFKENVDNSIPIVIENDGNCAGYAEYMAGNGQSVSELCLITIGTGIGGALIRNGEIFYGHKFKGGELGMMMIDIENGYHTLHDLAATSSLVNGYRKTFNIPESVEVTGEMIFQDQRIEAKTVLKKWAEKVAVMIFNVAVTLSPDKILIGGGISQNSQLLPLIKDALVQNPFWEDFQVPIEPCQFHNDSGLLGAYYLCRKKLSE